MAASDTAARLKGTLQSVTDALNKLKSSAPPEGAESEPAEGASVQEEEAAAVLAEHPAFGDVAAAPASFPAEEPPAPAADPTALLEPAFTEARESTSPPPPSGDPPRPHPSSTSSALAQSGRRPPRDVPSLHRFAGGGAWVRSAALLASGIREAVQEQPLPSRSREAWWLERVIRRCEGVGDVPLLWEELEAYAGALAEGREVGKHVRVWGSPSPRRRRSDASPRREGTPARLRKGGAAGTSPRPRPAQPASPAPAATRSGGRCGLEAARDALTASFGSLRAAYRTLAAASCPPGTLPGGVSVRVLESSLSYAGLSHLAEPLVVLLDTDHDGLIRLPQFLLLGAATRPADDSADSTPVPSPPRSRPDTEPSGRPFAGPVRRGEDYSVHETTGVPLHVPQHELPTWSSWPVQCRKAPVEIDGSLVMHQSPRRRPKRHAARV